mgnify:CR=1 FL=1
MNLSARQTDRQLPAPVGATIDAAPTVQANDRPFQMARTAVMEDDDGTLEPLSLRERIRASGLTFDAIAAEAVRYA